MTGRIERRFELLHEKREKALVAYLTAGDPNLAMTESILVAMERAGVDIVELGIPFSDPTADGPVIQAASRRALQSGITVDAILDMIHSVRNRITIPIILFGYYNPIFQYGGERFAARASETGVDGILIVDLPPEEAHELRRYTDREGLTFISLIAPTTSTDRIRTIVKKSRGFLYYISVTGVTGTVKPSVENIAQETKRIREISSLPLVVGFGISKPDQARELVPFSDGIVIGSAFVRLIEEFGKRADLANYIAEYAQTIKQAMAK